MNPALQKDTEAIEAQMKRHFADDLWAKRKRDLADLSAHCGNCASFERKGAAGHGWCIAWDWSKHQSDICNAWKAMVVRINREPE